jgi:hypothetical protein
MRPDSSALCPHELSPEGCATCRTKSPLTRVWVSGNGPVYHRSHRCQGLDEGKAIAESKGFRLAEVVPMTLGRAADRGYVPCLVCRPPNDFIEA